MVDLQVYDLSPGITWRSWVPESFQAARERDLPILLSISAVWCHWCHVMDRDTYRDPEVIRRVMTEMVPIRVDADRRPDINHRYNLGGWPTTAFLTPEGDLLTGGTFMPSEEFLDVLNQVMGYYREQRADLEQKLERRRVRRARITELRHRLRGDVTPETVDSVVEAIRKGYDSRYGGFGQAPKFPLADAIELALAIGYARSDQELLEIARRTLTLMAEGGIYDPVEGGLFRYSTTDDWRVPHYEKMLDGNARLLQAYLHGAQVLDEPSYRQIARGIQTFAEATLRTPRGTFGGSAKADEEYYHLRADARAERVPPAVDATAYSDWNAMMVSAYLSAAVILDEPYLADLAIEALEAVWGQNYVPGAGMAHYHNGSAHLPGPLADQAWMGHALLDAYAYLGQGDYRERAETLVGVMRARLWDPDVGGFYDVPYDPAAQGRLQERLKLLDENAVAADLALRLFRLTGNDDYHELAVGTLEAMAPLYRAYRHHAAAYGLAVYRFTHAPLHFIIVGDPIAEQGRALRKVALSVYDPNRLVESVDPILGAARLQQLSLAGEPAPALYVRRAGQTSPPIEDVSQVRTAAQAVLA
jgi:uncharacterized protein YyaL (SSP411 family)